MSKYHESPFSSFSPSIMIPKWARIVFILYHILSIYSTRISSRLQVICYRGLFTFPFNIVIVILLLFPFFCSFYNLLLFAPLFSSIFIETINKKMPMCCTVLSFAFTIVLLFFFPLIRSSPFSIFNGALRGGVSNTCSLNFLTNHFHWLISGSQFFFSRLCVIRKTDSASMMWNKKKYITSKGNILGIWQQKWQAFVLKWS